MFIPCERVVKEYLPAIRAATATKLVREHGYSQVKTASALGVTQAAVSGYLGKKATEPRNPHLRSVIEQLGSEISSGVALREHRPIALRSLCDACDLRSSGQIVCELNQKRS